LPGFGERVGGYDASCASRLGGTVAVPIAQHQSLKFSYSSGTYIRFGGNWQEVAVAWQYAWLGRPK
jgi:hypothetical protein